MNKLKAILPKIKAFLKQKKNKRLVIMFVAGFVVVFAILLSRSSTGYIETPLGIKIPTFNSEENRANPLDSNDENSINVFNQGDDIVSDDPDIVIEEDTSDPDIYKRNGIEGSGEATPTEVAERDNKIMAEFYAARAKAPSGNNIIYTNDVSYETAVAEKEKIKNRVPLFIRGYVTPNGKQVNILLKALDSDGADVVRVEVDGIDYNNDDVSTSNPDMVAYLDAMVRAADEFKTMGADINNMHIKAGFRAYINTTASAWLKFHGKFN